jgi:hypothetical protein
MNRSANRQCDRTLRPHQGVGRLTHDQTLRLLSNSGHPLQLGFSLQVGIAGRCHGMAVGD